MLSEPAHSAWRRYRAFANQFNITSASLPAFAVRLNQIVMVHNLPDDCRVKDEELIAAGIHSALMCPLTLGSQVFGAIGVLDDYLASLMWRTYSSPKQYHS